MKQLKKYNFKDHPVCQDFFRKLFAPTTMGNLLPTKGHDIKI